MGEVKSRCQGEIEGTSLFKEPGPESAFLSESPDRMRKRDERHATKWKELKMHYFMNKLAQLVNLSPALS